MALGNTPRRETNFYIEANKSYAFAMYFIHPDESPIDMTDAVLRLVAAEAPHVGGTEVLNLEAVSEDPRTGFMQFNLQADDLTFDPGSYAYDITLVGQTGYSTPILKGYIELGVNTDLDVSNTYTGVIVQSEMTITVENGDLIEITVEQVDGMYVVASNLIKDFAAAMQIQVDKAANSADESADSAALAASYAHSMQVWLDNAGYPFWKGTQAEFDALTPKYEVLYLITDESV